MCLRPGRPAQHEARAAQRAGAGFDAAIVAGRHPLDDRQPQAGAARAPVAAVVQADEGLEDVLPFGGRNAGPVVVDDELEAALGAARDRDVHVPVGIAHGVLHQVQQRAAHVARMQVDVVG